MVALVEFGIIIVIATIAGAIAIKLKQPSVIGLLIAGMIIGPSQLGLVGETEFVKLFAEVGSVLLLFAIGLEFSLGSLRGLGLKAVVLAGTKMGGIMLLGYLVAILLGLQPLTGLFLGAILSITSTAIFVKVVSEKNYANRQEVPLLVAMLIVEDIIAVFLLAMFAGLGGQGEFSLKFFLSIANSLFIFGLFYLVISRVLKVVLEWLAENRADETLPFASLAVGVGLSVLAQFAGIPASVGAFLAGNLIASLKQSEEFKQSVYPLVFVFSALFFLSIGMLVNFNTITSNLLLVIGLTILALLVKFLVMGASHYLVEGNSRSASFAALAMLSVGEFSLLIASLSKGVVTEIDLVGITSVLVLVTSIATGLLLGSHDTVWRWARKQMPANIAQAGRRTSDYNYHIFQVLGQQNLISSRVGSALAFVRDHVLVAAIALGAIVATEGASQKVSLAGFILTYQELGYALAAGAIAIVILRIVYKIYLISKRVETRENIAELIKSVAKLATYSALIWVAVVIIAILTIFKTTSDWIEVIALIALVGILLLFFSQGKQTRKPLIFGR